MDTCYVIQNQNGHYLSKNREWTDGRDKRLLYRSVHKDEVINLVFELSSKNIELRASYLECELDDSGNPAVQPSDTPLPLEATNGEVDSETEYKGAAPQESEESSSSELENAHPEPHIMG